MTKDRTRLKISAHQKFTTVNPGTTALTKSIRIALMTNVKRPRERIFMGRVINKRIGFSIMLTIPNTTATTNAVK